MLFVRDYLDDRVIHRHEHAPHDPVVSVIMPTFRRHRCGKLRRAVESVLGQTFRDFEFIVVDDGSTDGTEEYLADCCATDPRVVHVRHDHNSGLPGLRTNEGIELARGRFVAFQFDDDEWRPNFLEVLTTAAEACPRDAFLIGTSIFHHAGGQQRAPFVEVTQETLFENNRFSNNSVLIPRHLFDRHGMYDCHLAMRRACDWDLWLRLIRHVPFIVVPEIVADVFTFQEDSLGRTTAWDLDLFRFLSAIPRDHLLRPSCWHDYRVDGLEIGGVTVPSGRSSQVFDEHILPYYLKFRHRFPGIEAALAASRDRPRDVLLLANAADPATSLALRDCDVASGARGGYKLHRHHSSQVTPGALHDVQALLVQGLATPLDNHLASHALDTGRPLAYLFDRNPFPVDTACPRGGERTDYLSLVWMLSNADAVWLGDRRLEPEAHAYTRRTIPFPEAVAPSWLPVHEPARDPQAPLVIAVPDAPTLASFPFMSEALDRLRLKYGTRVELVEWPGNHPANPDDGSLAARLLLLRRRSELRADVVTVPLLDGPRGPTDLAAPGYQEPAVAGAVGMFSEVPAYSHLPTDRTCLKAHNTAEGWFTSLQRLVEMPHVDFDRLRAAYLRHVREVSSADVASLEYEAAWAGTEFHQLTRSRRGEDGRPRVAFFLHSPYIAGAETQLWCRLRSLPPFGIVPIVVLPEGNRHSEDAHLVRAELARLGIRLEFARYAYFVEPVARAQYDDESERNGLVALLRDLAPALVHTTTYMPGVGRACRALGIPHVASIYAIADEFEADPSGADDYRAHCDLVQSDSLRYTRVWGRLLGVDSFCARAYVPESIFDIDRDRQVAQAGRVPRVVMLATFQPRKGQLAAISATGALLREGLPLRMDLYGYTQFYRDYLEECQKRIVSDHAEGSIRFHGFSRDPASILLRDADILLCSSSFESFPTSISEAMAAGVLVVSTPAGGISELIVDGVSGILCRGTSDLDILEGLRRALMLTPEERAAIVAQARKVALAEFHPRRVIRDTLAVYARAIRNHQASARRQEVAATHEEVAATHTSESAPEPTTSIEDPRPEIARSVGRPALLLRSPLLARLRSQARRADTRMLQWLGLVHPGAAVPIAPGLILHPPHNLPAPHLAARAYGQMRRFARCCDTLVISLVRRGPVDPV